ncbi:hypothetical protein ASU28_02905 [Lactiplantibacillus paraplantarum]|nr:hypothetical protein ASU28_02905 [Lactiplantibacillus paraplantarum]KGE76634.1 hypothetical protein HR47_00385 [Lactiplantibacillus paraplantarum]OAX76703.1 hypothetical protein A0U96_14445 [Lactiplantibacillus plantarum]RDG08501.1 hypothetical protein DQM08_14580 [Lactiplantibacillus paraplantarum]
MDIKNNIYSLLSIDYLIKNTLYLNDIWLFSDQKQSFSQILSFCVTAAGKPVNGLLLANFDLNHLMFFAIKKGIELTIP